MGGVIGKNDPPTSQQSSEKPFLFISAIKKPLDKAVKSP